LSFAPVAGSWIARVSKGRTIKQVIHYGLIFPTFVCFAWLALFGGSAIKMQRQAVLDACRCGCSTVGPMIQRKGSQPPATGDFSVTYAGVCENILLNPFGEKAMHAYWEGTGRYGEAHELEEKTCSRQRPDGCSSIIMPSLRRPEVRLYDLLDQYEKDGDKPGTKNQGPFLNGIVLVCLILLTAASSLSGASVITLLLSSGDDPHGNLLLRFVVLGTQLALTSALLRAGVGSPLFDPITALQSLSIIAGIVFSGILMFFPSAMAMLIQENQSFYPSLSPTNDNRDAHELPAGHTRSPDWSVPLLGGFMDVVESIFSCFQFPFPPAEEFARFGLALLFPYAILPIAYSRIDPHTPGILALLGVWMFFFWWLFICAHIVEAAPYWCGINYGDCNPSRKVNKSEGIWSIAWTAYCLFIAAVAACRNSTRRTYAIPGSLWIDLFVSMFCYPLVISQISAQEIIISDDPQLGQVVPPPPSCVAAAPRR